MTDTRADTDLSEGDDIRLPARLVVAPEPGTFRSSAPDPATLRGQDAHEVSPGTILGTIETLGRSVEVTSAFAGRLMTVLACDGERVRAGQPVAWLAPSPESRP